MYRCSFNMISFAVFSWTNLPRKHWNFLFIILTYIHLTFKTHILRFSLSKSQNQKRKLNLFWKLKRWIEKPINFVASSFIIKFYHMHVQYVGIGILIDLKLCFNIGLSPPTVGNVDKLLSLYIFNATFCQIHFAQTSGQTRTKWPLSVCAMIINFMYMCIKINNTDLVSFQE